MRARPIAFVLVLLALLGGGYWLKGQRSGGEPAAITDAGAFTLVDAGDRAFEGSPAIALTFSQPLDARASHESFLQVFEMPPRPGERAPRDGREAQDDDEDNDSAARRDERAKQKRVSTDAADTNSEGGTAVKGAWVVGDNPRLLHFPHVKPDARYVVRVAAGLPAKAGAKLPAESRFSIRTAPVAPAFYFASRGVVLPARQNGGLPVVTVNVPDVEIQFLRVKPDQLSAFLDRVVARPRPAAGEPREAENDNEDDDYRDRSRAFRGAVSHWDLDSLHRITESVYSARFVTEQRPNKRAVTFIPVEDIRTLQEPGIYVAVMSQPGRFRYDNQVTYFYVSDLGLHLRQFARGADAWVSSLTDGKGVRNVEVSWLDAQGKVLARAETDSDGRATFAERPKGARVALARKGTQVSMIPIQEPSLDLSEYDITGLPFKPVRLFAWSGRNLYRPGEHFDLSVLARDGDGRPVPPQPVQAILKRPDGKTHFTASWTPEAAFNGYFRRRIAVPGDAQTGFWSLELRADPADRVPATVFRFGVEEFLPERMKLDLASKQAQLAAGTPYTIDVKGDYLYGAPAAGNRLLGVVAFERNRNPLAAKLPGFAFGDANEDGVRQRVEIPEEKLDDAGRAAVTVDLGPAEKRRSPFTVRTTLSLLESGGRPVVRSLERVWWPAPALVGVRPLFTGDYARENSTVEFEVVRADTEARLLAGAALPVRLFRENRDYYWRFDDQRGWHSGFTETDELVETAAVTVPAGGRGKLALPVRYGRYRVEVLDPETSQTLRFRFYAGWSARADEAQGVRPDRVALKLDKPAYREGDTASLTITAPHAGEALVTVEGDRTLWSKRIPVTTSAMNLQVPIDKSWGRHDLYVTVMVLRPGNSGDRVTPARALGLAYIPVDRGERKTAVTVEAPAKMLPETPLRVKVRVPGAKGEKAVVTLSAVDVGILNITQFRTPDPHGFFFGKLRYGADLNDVYGRLIEKMAGQKGRLRFGGDNTPKPTRSLPKKVRLVDLFSGPVALDANGEAEVTLQVPDFNGTLRVMAVVGGEQRYGMADAEVVVAAPLVAELATPRFLSFGDRATIALDLHNLSGGEQKLRVKLAADPALKVQEAERALALKDQQKTTLRFSVEALPRAALAEVRVKVETDTLKLDRSFAVQVQSPAASQTIVRRFAVAPGESLDLRNAELGGLIPSTVGAHLVLSNKPPIDVRAAIRGLLTYPYGCAEQTTSTAYPHVFVDEEAAKAFGLKPYTREQRVTMLDTAIGRLAGMQAANGGFSLWGNVSEYEYWLSAYITGFLVDARAQGFGVPEAMQRRAMDFLLKGLQEGVSGLPSARPKVWDLNSVWNDRRYAGAGRFGVLAAGAYVLARESKAPLATLRQLHESRGLAHSGLPLVQLGIALRLTGDEKRGDEAIREGIAKVRESGYWWGDYGSPLRDAAASYALLARHKVAAPDRDNLIAVIVAEMEKSRYYSTQEQLALFLVGREFTAGDATTWTAEVVAGKKPEALSAAGSRFVELDPNALAAGVRLTSTHKERLYGEVSLSGFPAKPLPPRADVIQLARELYNADGTPLGDRTLRVGESVLVRVNVKVKARIANGMVVDRVPAGLEIENLNIVQGEGLANVKIGKDLDPAEAMRERRIQHVEFRDDRFVAAVRLEGETNLFYRARAVTPGRFVVPPMHAEDMYRPDTYGLAYGSEFLTVSDGRGEAAAR
jgi:uncharacterized protein YfaS (alpha-2-macroglobulin family)